MKIFIIPLFILIFVLYLDIQIDFTSNKAILWYGRKHRKYIILYEKANEQ